MIRLKDLLMEGNSLYDKYGPERILDFTNAAKDIDIQITELREKKQKLASLKVEANKLWRINDKIERLTDKQMENPKWEAAEGKLNQDIKRFEKKLQDLGFGDITLDWRWNGVK